MILTDFTLRARSPWVLRSGTIQACVCCLRYNVCTRRTTTQSNVCCLRQCIASAHYTRTSCYLRLVHRHRLAASTYVSCSAGPIPRWYPGLFVRYSHRKLEFTVVRMRASRRGIWRGFGRGICRRETRLLEVQANRKRSIGGGSPEPEDRRTGYRGRTAHRGTQRATAQVGRRATRAGVRGCRGGGFRSK